MKNPIVKPDKNLPFDESFMKLALPLLFMHHDSLIMRSFKEFFGQDRWHHPGLVSLLPIT